MKSLYELIENNKRDISYCNNLIGNINNTEWFCLMASSEDDAYEIELSETVIRKYANLELKRLKKRGLLLRKISILRYLRSYREDKK